jgi:hypothetical protein
MNPVHPAGSEATIPLSADKPNGEALARARIPHAAEYYDLLRYEVDPLGGFRLCGNQKLPHITINDMGYRGQSFSGLETVLFLGDSVSFGVGASSDHARLSVYMGQALTIPVADASVRAYRVSQHFAHLPRLLERLPKVRTIFLWMGYADLLYWTTTGGSIEGAFQFERKYSADPVVSDLPFPLAGMSKMAIALINRFVYSRPENRAREKGSIADLVQRITLYVRAMADICSAREIGLHVLIQPFVRTRPADAELREIADYYDGKTRGKCGVGWYDVADGYATLLATSLGSIRGVQATDLESYFSENDYFDQVHLKEESLQAVAPTVVKLREKEIKA